VEIEVAGATEQRMHAAVEAAFAAVAKVHSLMSFHDPESDVGRLNRCAWAEPVVVHPWTWRVLQTAVDLHRRSSGAFDIAVAPVLQERKFLPQHPDEPQPTAAHWASAEAIQILPGGVQFKAAQTKIDLGGIAKGFAVDRAIDVLRGEGIMAGLVNAGGDLGAFGPNEWKVHIRDPGHPARLLCCVGVRDAALASSSRYCNPMQDASTIGSAIVEPRSGTIVRNGAGASVRAPSCMIADALTKVLLVSGDSAGPLLDGYGADGLIVFADGRLHMTQDFASAVCLAA
jgi:thiamine biosynthesis lipoprotein